MSVILETPDHPRSCGANLSTISTSSLTVGSSPLVRGQPVIFPPLSVRARIIPARAGPTPFAISVASSVADHPRSCGANLMFSSAFFISSGSSPLVRGQPSSMIPTKSYARIIPARAGPTRFLDTGGFYRPDHPRSCGANHIASVGQWFQHGSSPLVRGQRVERLLLAQDDRIIPARAGPTYAPRSTAPNNADHPRSCGANPFRRRSITGECGSSPLVRGQHPWRSSTRLLVRIIPARAGPTQRPGDSSRSRTDHPRSCGANERGFASGSSLGGSSPLVRGQHQRFLWHGVQHRIIPARAGPTTPCAENIGYQDGSSPLVRGQLATRVGVCGGCRIIPARAGPTGNG